jgi:hypothetical protein
MIKVKERGRTKAPETSNLASDTDARAAAPVPPAEQEADGWRKEDALAFIRAVRAPDSRFRLLTILGLGMRVGERQAVLLEALAAAASIPDASEQADLIKQVARFLPPADVEAALRKAPASKGKGLVDKYGKTSDNALAMGLLHEYLKTLGVPESRLPEMVANVHGYALAQAKREVAGHAAPKLSEADLAAFKKHAAANQWNPESKPKVSPSAFIKETFKEWLGRGLTRKHIEDAQENLAWAYSTEVCRKPSRRVEGLYVVPHSLPAGTPRPASKKLAAEMTDDELAETRKKNKTYKSVSRQRQQSLHI